MLPSSVMIGIMEVIMPLAKISDMILSNVMQYKVMNRVLK